MDWNYSRPKFRSVAVAVVWRNLVTILLKFSMLTRRRKWNWSITKSNTNSPITESGFPNLGGRAVNLIMTVEILSLKRTINRQLCSRTIFLRGRQETSRFASGADGHLADDWQFVSRRHGHDLCYSQWNTPRSTADHTVWEGCNWAVSGHTVGGEELSNAVWGRSVCRT